MFEKNVSRWQIDGSGRSALLFKKAQFQFFIHAAAKPSKRIAVVADGYKQPTLWSHLTEESGAGKAAR